MVPDADSPSRPITVLVIDDDPDFLDLTKCYLEETGDIRVETARSGDRALRLLDERIYDAVVSDYRMPVMDGLCFLDHVQEHHPHMPFILSTGFSHDDLIRRALGMGAAGYHRKGPDLEVTSAELAHLIRNAVGRQRAEAAREREHGLICRVFHTSDDLIVFFTPDGTVTSWNPAISLLTGVPAREAVGRQINEWIPRGCEADAREIAAHIHGGNRLDHFPFRCLRKDGMTVPIDLSISPIAESSGAIWMYVAVARPSTEQRKQCLLKRTLESVFVGCLIAQQDGSVTFLNDAARGIMGLDPATTVHLADILSRDVWEETISPALRSDGKWHGEVSAVRPDGSAYRLDLSAVVDHDSVTHDLTTVVFCVETTQRRQTEDDLLETLKEKSALLGGADRRVLKGLRALSGLIRPDASDPGDAEAHLKECEGRVRALSLVYESTKNGRVEMRPHFSALAAACPGAGAHDLDVEEISLDQETAIAVTLVLNELITSALRDGAGMRLRIGLQRGIEGYLLTVEGGDGREIPEGVLQLVRSGLHGSLSVVREGGTAVSVRFPDPEQVPARRPLEGA
ncbi:response regulator [Methanofollis fontis]|nr:response regulator [Methanofollis fontis]